MRPNIHSTRLSGRLLGFRRGLIEFERQDTPPNWSKDEYADLEDARENLCEWREALVAEVKEELRAP